MSSSSSSSSTSSASAMTDTKTAKDSKASSSVSMDSSNDDGDIIAKYWTGTTTMPDGAEISFRFYAELSRAKLKEGVLKVETLADAIVNQSLHTWYSRKASKNKNTMTKEFQLKVLEEKKQFIGKFLLEYTRPESRAFVEGRVSTDDSPSFIYRFKLDPTRRIPPSTINEAMQRRSTTKDDTSYHKWLSTLSAPEQHDIGTIGAAYDFITVDTARNTCLFSVFSDTVPCFRTSITGNGNCDQCNAVLEDRSTSKICNGCTMAMCCSDKCLSIHQTESDAKTEDAMRESVRHFVTPFLVGGEYRCLHCNKQPCTYRCMRCGIAIYCNEEHARADHDKFHKSECANLVPPADVGLL